MNPNLYSKYVFLALGLTPGSGNLKTQTRNPDCYAIGIVISNYTIIVAVI